MHLADLQPLIAAQNGIAQLQEKHHHSSRETGNCLTWYLLATAAAISVNLDVFTNAKPIETCLPWKPQWVNNWTEGQYPSEDARSLLIGWEASHDCSKISHWLIITGLPTLTPWIGARQHGGQGSKQWLLPMIQVVQASSTAVFC